MRASTSGAIPAREWTIAHKLPFLFTGTIDKLTFKLGLEQISGEERKVAERVLAAAHDLTLLEELPDWGVRISGLSASV